jgi:hypothetical protein
VTVRERAREDGAPAPDAHQEDDVPEHANDAAEPADATETPAEAQKRRFKEALDRKQGVSHPNDEVAGGKNLHGRGGATTRQEFRRKSG